MTKSDFSSDLIIIGGGVAGLAAAQYGARAALKTTVLDGTGGVLDTPLWGTRQPGYFVT